MSAAPHHRCIGHHTHPIPIRRHAHTTRSSLKKSPVSNGTLLKMALTRWHSSSSDLQIPHSHIAIPHPDHIYILSHFPPHPSIGLDIVPVGGHSLVGGGLCWIGLDANGFLGLGCGGLGGIVAG